MGTQFGEKIKSLKETQKMLLRHFALDIDTVLLSKIERGVRSIKREQVPLVAEVLEAGKEELITLWRADHVMKVQNDEEMADEALSKV